MSQSLDNVLVHLVFSTKERLHFLREKEIRDEMFSYLGGVSSKLGCNPILVGGMEDHVHMLVSLSRTISISDWIRELKKSSTLWMRKKRPEFRYFQWQGGYSIFSVSQSMRAAVENYIANQEKHHCSRSFQDELREMLEHNALKWDENFVWE